MSNRTKSIKGTLAAVLSVALITSAAAQSSFDGNWWVTMGAQDYANPNNRGLSHAFEFHFPATVAHGVFHGERGSRGEPAFYELNGSIQPDGTALLSASGITGKQEHNQGLVPPGVPYSYTEKALFKGSLGTGDNPGLNDTKLRGIWGILLPRRGYRDSAQGFNPGKLQFSGTPSQGVTS